MNEQPSGALELERLLRENDRFADQFDRSRLGPAPLSGLAILTCMDARMSVEDIFGLRAGDANIIRNAGAVASEDAIRSLILSQWVLGSRAVVVMAHTGCGLHDLREEELRVHLGQQTGQRSPTRFGAFHDLDQHVREQVARIRSHPWIREVPIEGLIYDVATGRVRQVTEAPRNR